MDVYTNNHRAAELVRIMGKAAKMKSKFLMSCNKKDKDRINWMKRMSKGLIKTSSKIHKKAHSILKISRKMYRKMWTDN